MKLLMWAISRSRPLCSPFFDCQEEYVQKFLCILWLFFPGRKNIPPSLFIFRIFFVFSENSKPFENFFGHILPQSFAMRLHEVPQQHHCLIFLFRLNILILDNFFDVVDYHFDHLLVRLSHIRIENREAIIVLIGSGEADPHFILNEESEFFFFTAFEPRHMKNYLLAILKSL